MLDVSGNSIPEIMQNINSMHGHLKLSHFSGLAPPLFRTTNLTASSMRLHYEPGKPSRTGLGALVVGLVKGIAELHLKWPPSALKVSQEKFRSKGADHDVFLLSWKKVEGMTEVNKAVASSTADFKFGLSPKSLNAVFPFHFVLNKRLVFTQIGSSLKKALELNEGEKFNSRFTLVSPATVGKMSFKEIKKHLHEEFVLRCSFDESIDLELKGQWISVSPAPVASTSFTNLTTISTPSKGYCFVGTPMIKSTNELSYLGLSLSDFAIHDPSKDRLFAIGALRAAQSGSASNSSTSSSYDDDSDTEDTSTFSSSSSSSSSSHNPSSARSSKMQMNPHTGQMTSAACPFSQSVVPPGQKKSLVHSSKPSSSSTSPNPAPAPVSRSTGPVPALSDSRKAVRRLSPSPSSPHPLLRAFKEDSKVHFVATRTMLQALSGDPLQEPLIKSLCSLFYLQGSLSDFFTTVCHWELGTHSRSVSSASMNQSPFRADSVSATVASVFLRSSCQGCLKETLKKMVLRLLSSPPESPEALFAIVLQLIQDLSKTIPLWPQEAVELLRIAQVESAKQERPNATVMTALVFLRLLGPMITFPEKHLITTQPLDESRKTLALISKLLLNIALGLKFEEGSEMAKYNQFVTASNQRLLFQFVDDLLDSQNKVGNAAFDDQEESVVGTIKGIVFNKAWSSIWPSDRTPSLELRNFINSVLTEM
eukprot:TRINITY_DN388_c0_g1_i2.p1 TRINITY_DN388_c0_g1~~TRINITY_DN388_c0_g1_i2.p1  ORF type:complete len:811 (+),score=301.65 TRINITY_DN388_c0_g1_i2:317-2434(+)